MVGPAWETFLDQPFDLGGGLVVPASAVSMGNPHLVLFLEDDPERFHVEHIGPALEHHAWFPERTNVEFARVGADGIDVRVWERGAGETLACGTGACAVAVAANEAGRAPAERRRALPGRHRSRWSAPRTAGSSSAAPSATSSTAPWTSRRRERDATRRTWGSGWRGAPWRWSTCHR